MKTNPSPISCERALSVLLGGPDNFSADVIGRARLHTSRCPRCGSTYAADLGTAQRNGFASLRRSVSAPLRVAVLLLALVQLVFAIPWLFGASLLPDANVAASHLTRDGAFGLVVASCALVTVWRPRYAHATVLIGLLVLVLQVVSGIVDEHAGAVTGLFETAHLLVALIVAGLVAIAVDSSKRATPRAKPRSRILHLQSSIARVEHASRLTDEV